MLSLASYAAIDNYILFSGTMTGNYNEKSFDIYVEKKKIKRIYHVPKKYLLNRKIKAGKFYQIEIKEKDFEKIPSSKSRGISFIYTKP